MSKTGTMHGTTGDMMVFLQQLRAKVAEAVPTESMVSDSEEEELGEEHEAPEPFRAYQEVQVLERSVTYTNGDTYTGSMLGDQRHGKGTHTTSVGDVYSGGWQYDARQGRGTFKAANGIIYEGDWVEDKAFGSGLCTYPDGSVYDGDWEADERSGWGKLTTADGQTYEGEWKANQPHGQGQWTFSDGVSFFRGSYDAGHRVDGQLVLFDPDSKKPAHTYTGRFKNNLRHGHDCVGVEEGLWVYRGSWKEDQRWGHGTCRYADGSVFEGQWQRDLRVGNGCLRLIDGTVYEGQWRDDKLHGVAKAKYASGEVYMGQWQNGQRHGHGKWTSAPKTVAAAPPSSDAASAAGASAGLSDGTEGAAAPTTDNAVAAVAAARAGCVERRETYIGGWVMGKREGQGVAEYADGGRYEGSWKSNMRHGQGLMIFPDGCMFRGMWDEDEWLQSAAEPSLCRVRGAGLFTAVAGQTANFVILARDELNNPRLSGGDTFNVLLVPEAARPHLSNHHSPTTTIPAPAAELAAAGAESATDAGAVSATDAGAGSATDAGAGSATDAGADSASDMLQPTGAAKLLACADAHDSDSSSRSSGPAAEDGMVVAVAVGDVQDNGDGTYSCSYRYEVAGCYKLHVTNGEGEHVAGSPYSLQLLPGAPSPRHCSISGPSLRSTAAGRLTEFHVTIKDALGNSCACNSVLPAVAAANESESSAGDSGGSASNSGLSNTLTESQLREAFPLEARLVGSNTLTAAIVDVKSQPGGSYACSYVAPTVPGLYVLEVLSEGRHVGSSPVAVKVLASSSRIRHNVGSSPAPPPQHLPADTSTLTIKGQQAQTATASTTAGSSNSSTGPGPAGFCASAAVEPSSPLAAAKAAPVADHVKWWGEVARQAYKAIDGCLEGFDEAAAGTTLDESASGLSGPEADIVKANPDIPVVERLEDLWLLSKLQHERKAKQHQQHHHQQQQNRKTCSKQPPAQGSSGNEQLQPQPQPGIASCITAEPCMNGTQQQPQLFNADAAQASRRSTPAAAAAGSAMEPVCAAACSIPEDVVTLITGATGELQLETTSAGMATAPITCTASADIACGSSSAVTGGSGDATVEPMQMSEKQSMLQDGHGTACDGALPVSANMVEQAAVQSSSWLYALD